MIVAGDVQTARIKSHAKETRMLRLFKLLILLLLLGVIGLVGFAYLGDLTPEPGERREEIRLDAG